MSDANLHPSRLPPSLWAATAALAPATTALPAGEHAVELLVVGAGVTGLSAALHATGRGARVMVLEASEIGFGASGRNNGLVIPALTRADPDVLVRAFGVEKGEALVAVLRDAADTVFGLVRRHGIACEAVQQGWVQPAHRESRLLLSRSRFEQWQRRGAPVELLDRDQVAAITGSGFWCGGWLNRSGGHLNPLGLTRGLARAAQAAGAAVHTHTPVGGLQRAGDGWRVATAGGSVRAHKVLLATHSYSGFATPSPWPGLAQTLVPVRSYQMATQPLPAALRATVLPQGHAMSDTQGDLHFAHLDAQGRIVTGGALAFAPGYEARLRRRIGQRLLKLYPQLQALDEVRFDHLWHGVFAATPDKLPRFWRLDDGVLGWVGCNGRGLALGTALGPVLADAALDGQRARVPLPFEAPRAIRGHAFAGLGVAAGTLYYRWKDGRD
ncbi:MAG: FAD-binding oxidoreductase [Rubrivivax sp.]|nr:FAD-binding oxidoreductase [Rubrivivax sp.]